MKTSCLLFWVCFSVQAVNNTAVNNCLPVLRDAISGINDLSNNLGKAIDFITAQTSERELARSAAIVGVVGGAVGGVIGTVTVLSTMAVLNCLTARFKRLKQLLLV